MKYKYLKGSAEDFDGAPQSATVKLRCGMFSTAFADSFTNGATRTDMISGRYNSKIRDIGNFQLIAHREPVTECTCQDGAMFDAPIGMPLNEFKCRQQSLCAGDSDANVNGILLNKITAADIEVVKYDLTKVDDFASDATINKYTRDCKGVQVDVYDVLQAFDVTNPALQHLIKKALCVGIRGHKTKQQDLQDIIDSAIRAKELESNK